MNPRLPGVVKQSFIDLLPTIIGVLVGLLSVGYGFSLWKILLSGVDIGGVANLLTLPIIAASAGIALWGHRKKMEFDKSEAYLDKALELMDQARSGLFDAEGKLTNDRISWVTSARLLKHAQQLKTLATVDAHKRIFDSEHDYQRHLFAEMALYKDEQIPPSFFLGAEYEGLTLGEAAYADSQDKHTGKWIPARIVSEVFRFFSYPRNYEDPLDTATELSPDEVGSLWLGGGQSLCDYLTFRQNFTRVAGKVITLNGPGKSRTVEAEDIDGEMQSLSGTYKH